MERNYKPINCLYYWSISDEFAALITSPLSALMKVTEMLPASSPLNTEYSPPYM